MPYANTAGVDPTYPSDSDPANVDDDLRDIKTAYNERLDDVMGVDFADDDPIKPTKYGSSVTLSSKQVGQAAEFDNGNSGTTKTIDWDEGNYQRLTLTGNCTLTLSNPMITTYVLRVINSGSFTLTWPSSVEFPNNSTVQPTASRTTVYALYWNGTYYNVGIFGGGYQP